MQQNSIRAALQELTEPPTPSILAKRLGVLQPSTAFPQGLHNTRALFLSAQGVNPPISHSHCPDYG